MEIDLESPSASTIRTPPPSSDPHRYGRRTAEGARRPSLRDDRDAGFRHAAHRLGQIDHRSAQPRFLRAPGRCSVVHTIHRTSRRADSRVLRLARWASPSLYRQTPAVLVHVGSVGRRRAGAGRRRRTRRQRRQDLGRPGPPRSAALRRTQARVSETRPPGPTNRRSDPGAPGPRRWAQTQHRRPHRPVVREHRCRLRQRRAHAAVVVPRTDPGTELLDDQGEDHDEGPGDDRDPHLGGRGDRRGAHLPRHSHLHASGQASTPSSSTCSM